MPHTAQQRQFVDLEALTRAAPVAQATAGHLGLDHLDRHLEAIRIATESGVPVRGNFVWSLLDNFEWGEGMTKRFGLVFVDFDDQRRIVKASGDWYRRAAAANALPPNEEDAP